MANERIKAGDVVQISPFCRHTTLGGCFMIVTLLKTWHHQGNWSYEGYVQLSKGAKVYYRCKSEDVKLIGAAKWGDTS